ncbi:LpxL/LpxP family acyltransferase [Legionella tunisiensis]|uniref:LpxL/LpxP family acyltransferase n=1 Tax=Legionella tunisiensis TaxID=1034944 RepID=UPI0002FB82F2|nr:hypothetical protein [Legionella tunisiensis]
MIEIENKLNQLSVSWAGRFLYYFLPYKKDVVLKNIDLVFQEGMGKKEKSALQWLIIRIFSYFEGNTFFPFMPMKRMQKQAEIRGLEYFLAASARGKGILLLSAHVGNWEVAPLISFPALKTFNKRIHCVRKTLKISLWKDFYFSGVKKRVFV